MRKIIEWFISLFFNVNFLWITELKDNTSIRKRIKIKKGQSVGSSFNAPQYEGYKTESVVDINKNIVDLNNIFLTDNTAEFYIIYKKIYEIKINYIDISDNNITKIDRINGIEKQKIEINYNLNQYEHFLFSTIEDEDNVAIYKDKSIKTFLYSNLVISIYYTKQHKTTINLKKIDSNEIFKTITVNILNGTNVYDGIYSQLPIIDGYYISNYQDINNVEVNLKNIFLTDDTSNFIIIYKKKIKPLSQQKIILFSDSIYVTGIPSNHTIFNTGTYGDSTITAFMKKMLPETTVLYNAGIGGTLLCHPDENIVKNTIFANSIQNLYYSMLDYSKAINSGNWDELIKKTNNNEIVKQISTIDFSTIDTICIAYGTNDRSWDNDNLGVVLEDENNLYAENSYLGALRIIIKNIRDKYPNINIIYFSPIWRCGVSNNIIVWDSDGYNCPSPTLRDYAEKGLEIAQKYNIYACDNYHDFINSLNWTEFYYGDMVHPCERGRKIIAERNVNFLKNIFNEG